MAWITDPNHSHIEFRVKHMMLYTVRGAFKQYTIDVDYRPDAPEDTRLDVRIETASLDTSAADRDTHLRSPDFFDVEKYPLMTFTSKRIKLMDSTHAKLTGDLTIKDVTREITLDVEYSGQVTDPWGRTSVGFTAWATVNRKQWDLTWNLALESGGWLVGDDININIDLELVKTPEKIAEVVH
jgi:polyisoprenoid-binding protein YceI